MNILTLKAMIHSFKTRDGVHRDFGKRECSFGRADERMFWHPDLKWIGDVNLVHGEQE